MLLSKGGSEESGSENRSGNEETLVCKTCCAEFFNWSELLEHQNKCTEEPSVLIVQEDERFPSPQGSPTESFLSAHSDPAETENMEPESESSEKGEENVSLPEENYAVGADDPMDTTAPVDKISNPRPLPPDSSESTIPLPLSCLSTNYGIPSTNVTLEILHSTRVAVAQFSQSIQGDGSGGKASSVAIPMILEQLMALQQQQVHQLQLIEQIRNQVAVMNRQPTQAALNPASKAFPSVSCTYHFQGLAPPPPVLPLSGVTPSTVNGQASVSQASRLEGPSFRVSQPHNEQSKSRENDNIPISSANPNASLSTYCGVSTLLPSCNGALSSASQSLNSPHQHSASQGNMINTSANLPLLPQSPPSGVIFPNPLASIAATTNALEPLASMIKHRKGKMPNASIFETKPSSEDPFFKHKCRFCAKVFGSDSALQIHLRSHTGERPFKCNICGNRFSTKGNLKVHFQRHKDKYPHVQMNPYPVPEYLDNIPTSSGIPYGMSFPPEKAGSTWLDSKPILQTLPPRLGLQLPQAVTSVENIDDSFSNAPTARSPQKSSLARTESTPLSPNATSTEKDIPIQIDNQSHTPKMAACLQLNKEGETTTISKADEMYLPTSCVTDCDPAENFISASHNNLSKFPSTDIPIRSNTPESTDVITPLMKSFTPSQIPEHIKASFPFGGVQESMQTSETSKLQQLVENIDKKMMDLNQCVICHRVLSCQSALKMHYRIHTGERPFKCKVCGRAFTTKGNLKTHFGVHRAKPPLQVQHSCPICQKKFTNAVVLQQHIRMHMGGQIPNTLPADAIQEKNNDSIHDETSFDSVNDYDDDGLDDISYEEEDISENGENPLTNLSDSSSSAVSPLPHDVSDVRISDGDSTVSLNHLCEHKMVMSGIFDNHPDNGSLSTGDLENQGAFLPESANIIHPPTPAKCLSEGLHDVPVSLNITFDKQERAATVKCEMSDCPAPNAINGAVYDQIRKSSIMEHGKIVLIIWYNYAYTFK